MKKNGNLKRGFGLIELLIGLTIISMVIGASFAISNRSLQIRALSTQSVQASLLLTEGAEALRLIRDSGWATTSALTLGTSYKLAWNGVMWATSTANTLIDGTFDRRFTLSAIRRDATTHKIVSTGGVIDTDGKLVTLSVSWKPYYGATTTRSTAFYLLNLFN